MEARFVPQREHPAFVYRQFCYDKGDGYIGHRHSIDYPTIVVAGEVEITMGTDTKRVVAPGHFIARKEIDHTIKALRDGTIWLCVFMPPAGYESDLREFWNELG